MQGALHRKIRTPRALRWHRSTGPSLHPARLLRTSLPQISGLLYLTSDRRGLKASWVLLVSVARSVLVDLAELKDLADLVVSPDLAGRKEIVAAKASREASDLVGLKDSVGPQVLVDPMDAKGLPEIAGLRDPQAPITSSPPKSDASSTRATSTDRTATPEIAATPVQAPNALY